MILLPISTTETAKDSWQLTGATTVSVETELSGVRRKDV